MNNGRTRHLAKILIHLAWCLEECVSASDVTSPPFLKALSALFVSSVFLKYLIENSKSDNFEELHMSLEETDIVPSNFLKGSSSVFCFIILTYYCISSHPCLYYVRGTVTTSLLI